MLKIITEQRPILLPGLNIHSGAGWSTTRPRLHLLPPDPPGMKHSLTHCLTHPSYRQALLNITSTRDFSPLIWQPTACGLEWAPAWRAPTPRTGAPARRAPTPRTGAAARTMLTFLSPATTGEGLTCNIIISSRSGGGGCQSLDWEDN